MIGIKSQVNENDSNPVSALNSGLRWSFVLANLKWNSIHELGIL